MKFFDKTLDEIYEIIYEDLKFAMKRAIKERIDYYSQFKSVCDVKN